jgi:TP901 family phage tail tape measure protein
MSEFLAEARILVRPDTTRFRAQLQEEINRAISQTKIAPIAVPFTLGAGQGLAAAAAATSTLASAQAATAASTQRLTGLAEVENTTFARQAVILEGATLATQAKGAADTRAAAAATSHAVAQGQVGKAAVASTAGMLGLRGAVLTAGTAFIAATVGFQALGKAIGSAISFERELNVFQVTAGATADQMERITEVARELGRDITLPGVAANDAAAALSLLARAGLSVEDSLGAVRGTLQLATAAQVDNATAAELVANALNSFKLSGDQATRVADLLAGAANESQGSITDMGLALKQTSAIAAGLGISIEDTVTILTQLSRAGLSASDAGTSFRQTLLRLIQDLPKVSNEVEKLGLNLRDSFGNIRPQVFEELGKRLKTLTPAARQLAIANLGGADAIRTLLILTRAQAGEFDTLEASITRAGLAQELAAARTKGLGGDVEATKNEFADLGITVGQVASGPLGLFVRTAGQAVGVINDLNSAVGESAGGGGFFSQFGSVINDFANSFARLNLQFQQGVRNSITTRDNFSALGRVTEQTTNAVNALADALGRATQATVQQQGQPGDTGLGVQQVLNRVAGFDEAEVKARISGDTNALLAVLQQEQQFLIDQLDRQFVQNRPALRRALENALLSAGNDIASISRQGAAATKAAADDAARAIRESDAALLDALSQRRDDAERRASAASATEGLQDDIRAQDRIQALIKVQIAKVRAQIKDEKTRRAAIRELRIALIASRREEEALRKERAQEAAANRQTSIELNISFFETTGNVNAEVQARQRLIALLKKQQAAVKKGSIEWRRLRNEIAEQQEAIKEAKEQQDEAQKESKTFAQSAFEFAQTLQGFSANLLGNLIPGFATGGLVGNVETTQPGGPQDVGAGVRQAGELQAADVRGVRPIQVDTTNQLLRQILNTLQGRTPPPPETAFNWRETGARMDTLGGV